MRGAHLASTSFHARFRMTGMMLFCGVRQTSKRRAGSSTVTNTTVRSGRSVLPICRT